MGPSCKGASLISAVLFVLLTPWFIAGLILLARRKFIWGLAFMLLAVLGWTLTFYPEIAAWAATFLGVGRGTDLVVYVAISFAILFSAYMLIRNYRLEGRIETLTRDTAIRVSNLEYELEQHTHGTAKEGKPSE